jgi:O-antigen ligase/tetratricopeptide (TPR) repeat protein
MLAIFAVPFAFGGRHSIGQFLLIISAVWSALAWAMLQFTSPHPNWIRSRLEPLLLLIVSVGALQIVPLPAALTGLLSPQTAAVLPMWNSPAGVGLIGDSWPYLSLTVTETRAGVAVGLAYVLLFLVAVQRIRDVRDARRIVCWIAMSGGMMVVFALVQYLFSNGKLFWVFEHPQVTTLDRPIGAFLNKNHFSQFIAVTIGPLVCWLFLRMGTRSRRTGPSDWTGDRVPKTAQCVAIAALVALSLVAVLIARSRGGFLAVGGASAVLLFGLYAKSLISRRQLGVLSGIGLTVCLLMGIVGHDKLTRIMHRLDTWSDNGRFPIWQANLQTISEFPIIGTGIGSHRYVYQRFLDQPFRDGEYSHAESSYLQILTETGLIGFSVCVVCVLLCFYWCCRGVKISQSRDSTLVLCAATATLVASCIQSLGDFVWYIPGCMVMVVLMMACAFRVYQMEMDQRTPPQSDRVRPLSRARLACGMLGIVPLGLWMGSLWLPRVLAEPHWVDYRRVILAPAIGRKLAPSAEGSGRLKQVIVSMRKATQANPNDSRFHVRLAAQYTRLFHVLQSRSENNFPLNQVRDAAIAGDFESPVELREWLERSCGDHIKYAYSAEQHVRRAIELNPLEAHAYLYLSELAFLSGAPDGFGRACVAQSLTLRPYDANILFAAGRDARLDGDVEKWIKLWKQAFHRDASVQSQIIRQLAEWTPTPVEIIAQVFEPDVAALERMTGILEAMELPDDRHKALTLLSAKLSERAGEPDNRHRAQEWLSAAAAFGKIGENERVAECLDNAYQAAPTSFVVRLEYGAWLLRNARTSEASRHLEWCQRMRPDHAKLNDLLSKLNRATRPREIQQASAETRGRF